MALAQKAVMDGLELSSEYQPTVHGGLEGIASWGRSLVGAVKAYHSYRTRRQVWNLSQRESSQNLLAQRLPSQQESQPIKGMVRALASSGSRWPETKPGSGSGGRYKVGLDSNLETGPVSSLAQMKNLRQVPELASAHRCG